MTRKPASITGVLEERGEYVVTLRAKNALGQAERKFKIVCGDAIALTPPLGWNSWNCFAGAVDDAKVRSAADAMVRSGLTQHGWTYINIDDCWEIKPGSDDPLLKGQPRDAHGMINTNKKFPDMKALCDYIHGKGLKAGIYSSPGPLDLRRLHGELQARRARCPALCRMGLRLSEVRLVLVRRDRQDRNRSARS